MESLDLRLVEAQERLDQKRATLAAQRQQGTLFETPPARRKRRKRPAPPRRGPGARSPEEEAEAAADLADLVEVFDPDATPQTQARRAPERRLSPFAVAVQTALRDNRAAVEHAADEHHTGRYLTSTFMFTCIVKAEPELAGSTAVEAVERVNDAFAELFPDFDPEARWLDVIDPTNSIGNEGTDPMTEFLELWPRVDPASPLQRALQAVDATWIRRDPGEFGPDFKSPYHESYRRFFAIAQELSRGLERIALPRKTVGKVLGCSDRTVVSYVQAAERSGLLALVEPHRRPANGKPGRAARYRWTGPPPPPLDVEQATTRTAKEPVSVESEPEADHQARDPRGEPSTTASTPKHRSPSDHAPPGFACRTDDRQLVLQLDTGQDQGEDLELELDRDTTATTRTGPDFDVGTESG